MAEQEHQEEVPQEVEQDDDNPLYKPPAKKNLDEIVNADADDESLRKYKETLLGKGAQEVVIIDESKGNVIVEKLSLLVNDREPMCLDLTKPAEELKECVFTLKEKCNYKIQITFKVQREIVTGLRYEHKAYRKGVKVDSMKQMMGSYAPRHDPHEFKTEEEEAPHGMLMRGDYKIKSCFIDDDKVVYASWEWNLSIKKDW